ncbi:MAG: hypothetical protein ACYC91_01045 [Solirubrobacteraceae bacterium]
MTRRISVMAAMGALVLVAPGASQAKPPGGHGGRIPSSVTIAAAHNPILYGNSVVISGKLTAKTVAGVSVTLKAAPYPYTSFAPVATTTTDSLGGYHFSPSPKLNTEYRVMAKSQPPAISTTLLMKVRTRVAFRLSTRTPKVGARVTFSGSVTPAHNGQLVLIQRRRLNGTFVTVATTRLSRTITGAFSTYRDNLRIRASGTYRVIKLHDADHAIGFSRLLRITVHR